MYNDRHYVIIYHYAITHRSRLWLEYNERIVHIIRGQMWKSYSPQLAYSGYKRYSGFRAWCRIRLLSFFSIALPSITTSAINVSLAETEAAASTALLFAILSLEMTTTDEIFIVFLNLLIEFMVVIVHSSWKTVSYSSTILKGPLSMRWMEIFITLSCCNLWH